LPEQLQRAVNSSYDAMAAPKDGIWEIDFHVALGDEIPPTLPPTTIDSDKSLRGLLLRSGDAFITWRYVYELFEENRVVSVPYEFGAMDNAAKVFRVYVVDILRQHQEKYGSKDIEYA
jgi:hypothetical protein